MAGNEGVEYKKGGVCVKEASQISLRGSLTTHWPRARLHMQRVRHMRLTRQAATTQIRTEELEARGTGKRWSSIQSSKDLLNMS